MSLSDTSRSDRSDRRYISATMGVPLLDRDREVDLARRWLERRDEEALHELVGSHARLVVRIASGFRGSGLPFADLIQEGNIGVMEAASRFDPERNVRFSTYATWWIVAAIQNYILRNSSIVRAATTPKQRRLFFNLRRIRARHAVGFDGTLSTDERERIADKLDVRVDDVQRMEAHLSRPDRSLSIAVGLDESTTQQDLLADTAPTPEDVVAEEIGKKARKAWVDRAMARLTPRERRIIACRFLTERRITLAEIGREMGVSKERIRQIESRALEKMQAALAGLLDNPKELFET